MRKQRKTEGPNDRTDRLEREANRKIDDARASDDAVDEMIRRNVEQHGP